MSAQISLVHGEKKNVENIVQNAYKSNELWQRKGLIHHPCVELKEKLKTSISAVEIALQYIRGANLFRHLLATLHVESAQSCCYLCAIMPAARELSFWTWLFLTENKGLRNMGDVSSNKQLEFLKIKTMAGKNWAGKRRLLTPH